MSNYLVLVGSLWLGHYVEQATSSFLLGLLAAGLVWVAVGWGRVQRNRRFDRRWPG